MFPQDIDINNIMTMLSIIENDLDEAERIALEGLKKVPFNFDLLYNLGFIYKLKNNIKRQLIYILKQVRLLLLMKKKGMLKRPWMN